MFACCKKSGMAMAFPDVCQTPAPDGTVPIPYPNIAQMEMAAPGCEKVMITGMPAITKSDIVELTDGDSAGAAGGEESGTIMEQLQFTEGSQKVTLQGSPSQRMGDPTTQNNKNAEGTVLAPSQTKVTINA